MDVKFLGFAEVNPAYGSQLLRNGTGPSPTGSRFGKRSLARFPWDLLSGFAVALHEMVGRGISIAFTIHSLDSTLQLRSEKWKLERWVSRGSTQPTGWLFLGGEASNCQK